MIADRAAEWRSWMNQTRAALAALPGGAFGRPAVRDFFINHYAANEPALIELPRWPARNWTLDILKRRLGDALIEADTCPLASANPVLRMPFSAFADLLLAGRDDGYITGRGAGRNNVSLAPLVADIVPLPSYIQRVDGGQFFLGNRTLFPLHHDLANVLLCQIRGRKHVRMISPDQTDRVDNYSSTFSGLGWVSDEVAAARGLVVKDYVLTPGQALFLPVGWWHCVKAIELSFSVSCIHFRWPNRFVVGFPLG